MSAWAAAPESMTVGATVTDWEDWMGMRFPEDGESTSSRAV